MKSRRKLPLGAVMVLLVTAAVSLAWSHFKLLSQDEIFVLQTDGVSSVRQLVDIQRYTPISLDPLVYHLLAHAATKVFGATAFALRLPSLLGFLLMQVCLYLFVRRYASEREAVFAMAFPALTATLFYAAEARPYGLLLGLYALTLLCWRRAVETERGRAALIALAFSVALALNTHYFGVLLLVPLCGAELARTVERRRLDAGMVAAIGAGVACILFTLPFQKAAGEFRQHYYNGGSVGLRAISQAYRSILVDYTHTSHSTQSSMAFLLGCATLLFAVACYQMLRRRTLPFATAVFVVTLTALPFFGFLLARFVTHSFEVRYVVEALVGISILMGLVGPSFKTFRSPAMVGLVLSVAVGLAGCIKVEEEKENARATFASLAIPESVVAAAVASPSGRIYVQDMGRFEVASLYAPAEIRARLALVYSRENEIRYDGHDTVSLTAMHMRGFTPHVIVPYEEWKRLPGSQVLLQYRSGWNWTADALAADGADVHKLSPVGEGEAVVVRF